jgi:hypothetical protein
LFIKYTKEGQNNKKKLEQQTEEYVPQTAVLGRDPCGLALTMSLDTDPCLARLGTVGPRSRSSISYNIIEVVKGRRGEEGPTID